MGRLLVCLLLFNSTVSGTASAQWHEGVIVLRNNQILVGRLAIEPAHNLILFSHPDSTGVTVLPAFRIKAANFFDAANNINRRFISVEKTNFNMVHNLYEVVLRGTLWVLRKPARHHSVPLYDDEYLYYLLVNSELVPLKKFGTTVYPQLNSLSERQLSSYVRSKHFNPHRQADAIRIIQYFNSLEIPVVVLSKK